MPAVQLSDSTVAFIEREVAIDVASRDAERRPSACRGFACHVAPDRQRLTVFVRRGEGAQVLQDVLCSDSVAVVFCLPENEAALQIKGRQVSLSAATPHDDAHVATYCQRFVEGVVRLGFGQAFAAAYMTTEAGQMVAISFTPEAVFEQTPGPRAGQHMEGSAE